MIRLIDSPTERTTAATDLLLALQATLWAIYLGQLTSWKALIWATAFSLLAVATTLGAIRHGLVWADRPRRQWQHGTSFALGLCLALFFIGLVYDLGGPQWAALMLPVAVLLAVAFFSTTLFFPAQFIVFVIYEALLLVAALCGYGWLMLMTPLAGSGFMVLGILLTLIAAIIQTRKKIRLTFIWVFDNNGLFHLIQLVANIFILLGLRASLGGF